MMQMGLHGTELARSAVMWFGAREIEGLAEARMLPRLLEGEGVAA